MAPKKKTSCLGNLFFVFLTSCFKNNFIPNLFLATCFQKEVLTTIVLSVLAIFIFKAISAKVVLAEFSYHAFAETLFLVHWNVLFFSQAAHCIRCAVSMAMSMAAELNAFFDEFHAARWARQFTFGVP